MLKYVFAFFMMMNTQALAEEAKTQAVTASGGYAYAPIGMSKMGVGYLTLHNTTTQNDAVMSAQSSAFKLVELHDHIKDGDVMKMRKVDMIELPVGK